MTTRRPKLVVVGGGYAGVMAARAAANSQVDVTLVDRDGRHGLLPRLATVAAGVGPAEDADVPLPSLLPRVRIAVGDVATIDHRGQVIKTADGQSLDYDALVVAGGAQAKLPDIPGLHDWAWSLRTTDDALRLRERIPACEALVIIGAGPTGTQLAGEVAAHQPRVRVTLADMADRILPTLPEGLSSRAHEVLTGRGVDIRTGVEVSEVALDGAVLGDGSTLPGTVVWAGGFTTVGNVLLPDAATVDGRIVVDRRAQVIGHGPVFAAGDIAAHRGPGDALLPQTAQVAVRAGKLAGANAVRVATGRRARAATLRHIGWVLPLGGGQAVAQVGPLQLADPITGRIAPFLHDVIDLRHLLTVGGLPAAVHHHQEF